MTIGKVLEVMNAYIIPLNVHIMSDSGWECNETEMNGIWYNRKTNTMIFTQDGGEWDSYAEEKDWVCVYGESSPHGQI